MRQQTRLVINILSNYGTFFVYGAINLFLSGFVARALGKDLFGVATLVLSFTMMTELLGGGTCITIAKQMAGYTKKTTNAYLYGFVNTGFVWLLICSVFGAATCVFLSFFINKISNIPAIFASDARNAMLLMALKVFICFPFNVFQSVLWSYQRYDLTNLARTTAILLRAAVVVLWFELISTGLTEFMYATIFSTLVERLIWIYSSYKIAGTLRFGLRYISFKLFRGLFDFSRFIFIITISNLLGYEAIKWVISIEMPILEVGAYSLVTTLAMFACGMVRAISGILMPTASNFNANNLHDKNKTLAVLSTKYSMIVAGMFCIVPLFLFRPFLTFWMGDVYANSYLSKIALAGVILLIGQYIVDSSACSSQIITGMGNIAILAIITFSWAISGLLVIWVFLHWFQSSIIGVSLIITIARTLGSFASLIYGMKVIGVSKKVFFVNSLLKPTFVSIAVCCAGLGITKILNVYNLLEFILVILILGALYFVSNWIFIFSSTEKKQIISTIIKFKKNKHCEKFAVSS